MVLVPVLLFFFQANGIDPAAPDAGTELTNEADFDAGMLVPMEAVMLAGTDTVTFEVQGLLDQVSGESNEAFDVITKVGTQTETTSLNLVDRTASDIIYTLEPAASEVLEGSALTFTVTASRAVDQDTDVTFMLKPGNPAAPDN